MEKYIYKDGEYECYTLSDKNMVINALKKFKDTEFEFEFDDNTCSIFGDLDDDRYGVITFDLDEWKIDVGQYDYYYSDGMQREWHEHWVCLDQSNYADIDIDLNECWEEFDNQMSVNKWRHIKVEVLWK